METKANHVLIGAFTLAVAAFMLLFALWAAKYSSEQSWREYDVIFREAVTGLSEGGQVQYNGIVVGNVKTLSLEPDDPRKVIARIRVRADTPVKVDTRAKLAFTGITGVAIIQLSGGGPESPALTETPGRDVPLIRTQPSALQNLADTAEDVVNRLNRLLSERNIRKVSQVLTDLQQITGSVAGQREDIKALIVSAREASQKLEATLGRIDGTVAKDLPRLVASLERSLDQLDSFTRNADALVADNRDSITRFSNEGLGQIAPTLAQLRATLREIDRLTKNLKDNPADYLLGRDTPEEFEP